MNQVDITVKFTDVYGGSEIERTERIAVCRPGAQDDIDEWADEFLRPHTGSGRSGDAGYFAEIVDFPGRPDLVGHEFTWGV
ncbi:MAG: hypothetical protein WAV90_09730 [Gordonia amarae]